MSLKMKANKECPKCKRCLDTHTDIEGSGLNPSEGDICICFYCYQILEYQEDGKLKTISIDNITDEEDRARIISVMPLLRAYKSQKSKDNH